MEHPHDPYHVRPFPQQPHRGGKELVAALADLETALSADIPDFEEIRAIQERIHRAANTFNDDRLVNQIRLISTGLDEYHQKPEKELKNSILERLLKVRVDLKHL